MTFHIKYVIILIFLNNFIFNFYRVDDTIRKREREIERGDPMMLQIRKPAQIKKSFRFSFFILYFLLNLRDFKDFHNNFIAKKMNNKNWIVNVLCLSRSLSSSLFLFLSRSLLFFDRQKKLAGKKTSR